MALDQEWGRTKGKVQQECNFELVLRRLKEILEITIVYSMKIISIYIERGILRIV